jgi:3-hydroxyacyl-[acyl-carrier-protein] dehydratase
MDTKELTSSVAVNGDSPWFSGHFPDDPIFPGVAQLKMVADLVSSSVSSELRMKGMSRVKFRKIVRPGDLLDICVSSESIENMYMFKITSGGEDVCSGKMAFSQMKKEEHIHE